MHDIGDGPLDDTWLQEDPEEVARQAEEDRDFREMMAEIDAVERLAAKMGVA